MIDPCSNQFLKCSLLLCPRQIHNFEHPSFTKDINVEKAFLIKELEQVEDVYLLKANKAMLHYGLMNDGRISPEQYNRELEEVENRIDNGEFFTQDEVEKIVKKW